MKPKQQGDVSAKFENLRSKPPAGSYVLRLYITGATPQSLRAVANIKRICEERLHGAYRLEVVDLYQQPELAGEADIVAAPTLIKHRPLPVRRILGDMSRTDRVLAGLGLEPHSA